MIYLLTLLMFTLGINFTLNSYTRSKSQFDLKKQPKSIVVGHSHPECAFNDSLIQEFKNFSSSGESYFYTYPKLKNIILAFKKILVSLFRCSGKRLMHSLATCMVS